MLNAELYVGMYDGDNWCLENTDLIIKGLFFILNLSTTESQS